jgi:hypothetical protein
MATTITEEVYTVEEVAATSYAPEELGFGSWKTDMQQIDSVDYVNRLRDAAPRTLSGYMAELWGECAT